MLSNDEALDASKAGKIACLVVEPLLQLSPRVSTLSAFLLLSSCLESLANDPLARADILHFTRRALTALSESGHAVPLKVLEAVEDLA